MHWTEQLSFPSSDSKVIKYVFTNKTAIAEAVLYKYPTYQERTVICCSTQSGCPIDCTFCGTGKKFIRNLIADEIVEQVKYAIDINEIDTTTIAKFQIMFMSMGEPFLNYNEVKGAIKKLHKLYPEAQLLISTMAPITFTDCLVDFIDLCNAIPKIGLQFSIHESTDEARNKLIPVKIKCDLHAIKIKGSVWGILTGRKPFINYCVHKGNNTEADADRLVKLFKPSGWEYTLSVICEKDESVSAAIERQVELCNGFAKKLLERGASVRIFNPAGQDDIGGGCGQLWFVQKWLKERK